MGGKPPPGDPVVKGAACQCLDRLPTQPQAMTNLQNALVNLANSNYAGLETVLGQYLLPILYNPQQVSDLVQHLKQCWFDPSSPTCYFPNIRVAELYATGLLRTLSLSLAGTPALPIDSYWVLDHATFEMLNFGTARQVTLIIATPKPRDVRPAVGGVTAQAWSTRQWTDKVEDRKIETPSR